MFCCFFVFFLVAWCFSWASSWVAPTSGEKSIQTCRHPAAPVAVGQPAPCWQGRRLVWRDRMVNVYRLEPSDGRTGPCWDESRIGGGEHQTDRTSLLSTRVHVAAAAHSDDSCYTPTTARVWLNISTMLLRYLSERKPPRTLKCWCWNAVWSLLTVCPAMQVRAATKHGEPPGQQRQRPVIWLHAIRDPHRQHRWGPQLQE